MHTRLGFSRRVVDSLVLPLKSVLAYTDEYGRTPLSLLKEIYHHLFLNIMFLEIIRPILSYATEIVVVTFSCIGICYRVLSGGQHDV